PASSRGGEPKMRFALVALGAVLLLSGLGRADERDKAREAYRSAAHHYDFGEYRQALKDFKDAYSHYEDPVFLFNIAQCHRQLGETADAIQVYRAYLRNAPNAPNRAEVEALIARLQQQQTAPPQKMMSSSVGKSAEKSPVSTSAPAAVIAAHPPAPARTPTYKKWWVWTTVGVVLAAAGVGVGLGLGLQPHTPAATTDFGTRPFP
ncbi:MAG: tol-pal system YbgF family protein, partial [Solirubrobacterales bacterium]